MAFKNYDPALIVVTFAGIQIGGYAAGTFVKSERSEDAFSKKSGSKGDITRVRSRDRSGSITVTLMAESPTNDQLSARAVIDEVSGLGSGAAFIKNLNGTTLVTAPHAWIRKLPVVEYGNEAGDREWVIDVDELVEHVGGALI